MAINLRDSLHCSHDDQEGKSHFVGTSLDRQRFCRISCTFLANVELS